MSQDLFAAFGSFNDDAPKPLSKPVVASSSSFFDDLNIQPSTNQPNATATSRSSTKPTAFRDDPEAQQDDDDWGDFEGVTKQPASNNVPIAAQFSQWLDDDEPQQSSKPSVAQPAFSTFVKPSKLGPSITTKVVVQPPYQENPRPFPARDPHVLFDAEEDEPDDDDFGDFEEPMEDLGPSFREPDLLGLDFGQSAPVQTNVAPPAAASTQQMSSLLDLDSLSFDAPTSPKTSAKPAGPHYDLSSLGPVTSQLQSAPKRTAKPAVTKWSTDIPRRPASIQPPKPEPIEKPQIEEPWDDFAAWDEEKPVATQEAAATKSNAPPPLLSSALDPGLNELPPINIPPPASILSLFPPLFNSADSDFFRPTSSEPQNIRSRIFSDPATITYLKGLLALATVCARVIAGRKNRWKRDTILAQSMRMGPAAARGSSGLKLTSVDKSESTKEDREAADVLRAWQALLGRLKAAIVEVKKVTGQDLGLVPDLRDVMPIRVAKQIEGGIPGKACALCGLKREERVGKVDLDVMDSFGEWWIESMNMHRVCRNFWEEQKEILRQR
ncbi:hypothetical protein E6O75_ATG02625 [Venturia nashicola]|uniref:Serine/threonine-protein kinase ppk6 n=1 Tax=Venturia nashicola TaxID=86259 RepID=A0A4Z1PLA6_9PEZI|nr:hypothetical protein E6O75_ATG02625 [Venturia nashicola]